MTNRSPRIGGVPRDKVDGAWEEGRFKDDAHIAVRYAWLISRRLHEVIGEQTKVAFAEKVGVARATIHDILSGRCWPDMVTLTQIEEASGESLWPTPDEVRLAPGRR